VSFKQFLLIKAAPISSTHRCWNFCSNCFHGTNKRLP